MTLTADSLHIYLKHLLSHSQRTGDCIDSHARQSVFGTQRGTLNYNARVRVEHESFRYSLRHNGGRRFNRDDRHSRLQVGEYHNALRRMKGRV